MNTKRIHRKAIACLMGAAVLLWLVGTGRVETISALPLAQAGTSSATLVVTTVTPTPTATPTASPTIVPTPAYPSVQDIRDALREDFKSLKDSLEQVNTQPSLPALRDNLISNVIWACAIALGGAILGKLAIWLKLKRDSAQGKPSDASAVLASTVLTGVVIACLALSAILFATVLLTPMPASQSDMAMVTERLDRIDTNLQVLSRTNSSGSQGSNTGETTSSVDAWSPVIVPLLIVSLLGNLGLILVYSRRHIELTSPVSIATSSRLAELVDRDVLNAVLLAIILLLLPYPADTLFLPFIIRFFILGVFAIARIYPDLQLRRIFVQRYSWLVFFAVFGTWLSFGNLLLSLIIQEWGTVQSIIYQIAPDTSREMMAWIEIAVQVTPHLFAILMAFPAWWHISQHLKAKVIPELEASLDHGTSQAAQ